MSKKTIILLLSVGLGLLLTIGGTILVIKVVEGLPSLEQLENPKPDLATTLYTEDGEILDQFFVKRRSYISRDSIPEDFFAALLATEDREFYNHWGIHTMRIVKAMVKNVIALRAKEGASTLTQQLARNLYLSSEKSILRKLREAVTAVQIERSYTKKEILELYANTVYFGRGAYGIRIASQLFFGKEPMLLTKAECAYLVALLKAPEGYDADKNYEKALQRRNLVLANMVEYGALSKSEYDDFKEEPIDFAEAKETPLRRGIAPHFVEMLRQQLAQDERLAGYNLYRDGLTIVTTIDSRMQKLANEAVEQHLREFQPQFDKAWKWDDKRQLSAQIVDAAIKNRPEYVSATGKDREKIMSSFRNDRIFRDSVLNEAKKVQVGFVVLDAVTGKIKAMVGGGQTGVKYKYSLNHATQIKRQPGSSFKAFVYASALEQGATPETMVESGPFSYTLPDGSVWRLSAHENEPRGQISLREGLRLSINSVAARLITEKTTPENVVRLAKRMGITSKISAFPAIALGTEVLSPLELTRAYNVFPNHGQFLDTASILRIEDRFGNVLYQRKPNAGIGEQVLSPKISSDMTSLLSGVVNGGTASGVRKFYRGLAAGKTGTTNDFADAWFVGYTPQLTAGVWVGFDDQRIKFTGWYGQGGKAAAPIWARFMGKVYADPELKKRYTLNATFTDSSASNQNFQFDPDNIPEEDVLIPATQQQSQPTEIPDEEVDNRPVNKAATFHKQVRELAAQQQQKEEISPEKVFEVKRKPLPTLRKTM